MVNYDAERTKREYPRRPPQRGSLDENPGPSRQTPTRNSNPPPPAQRNRVSNESKKSSMPTPARQTIPRQRNDSRIQQQQQPLQKNRQSGDRGRSLGEDDSEKKRLTIQERMEKAHREHLSNKFMKIEHAPKDNVELERQAYWGYNDYHDSDTHWQAIREERAERQKARAQSMMNASKGKGKGDKPNNTGDNPNPNHPPQTRASQMRMVYVQKKLSKGNDRRRSSSVVESKSMLKKRDSKQTPMPMQMNSGGIWNKNDKNEVPSKKKSSARDSDPEGGKRLRSTKAETRLAKGSVDSSEEEKHPPPKRDRIKSKKD